MPRFAVLAHDWPMPHFDFFLEAEGVLRAWRLPALPVPGECVSAEARPDHRLAYLDYEGVVSGGRGTVTRLDGGAYENLADDTFALHGTRLHGTFRLADGELCWLTTP